MERENWQNLNGEWDFEFDFGRSGRDRDFYKNGYYSKKIKVPFCPESKLSGIEYKDFIPAVWYRRFFEISREQVKGTILLHFGAVYYMSVVYVNGEEVYRDNMPAGPITSSTSATGSYALASYHNVIRPGSEVSATASILAVEIHFNHLPQSFVDFDAYLATYTPNIENSDCMMYADQQAVSGADNAFRMWDFSINTYLSINEAQLPLTAVYSLNGAKAYINAVAIYTPSNYDRAPMAFKWKGAMSSSSEYTTVIDVTSASYAEAKYHVFNGYFNANVYNSYRLEIISSSSYPLYAYEIVPCICKTKYPTAIEFEQSSYTAFANYQSVSIRPTLLEFTNCQITPSLPSGLSFDPVTCTLSGTTATATPATTYTVTSTVAGKTFTGSFSLEFQGCNNNFIRIVRTYKANPHTEYFSVMDLSNNATILSVAKNSGQPANVDVNYYLCTTAQKIQVETFTSSSYWQHDSYLYLYNMFNADNTEIIGRVHRDHNYAYPTVHTFNIQYAIPAHSNWYYKSIKKIFQNCSGRTNRTTKSTNGLQSSIFRCIGILMLRIFSKCLTKQLLKLKTCLLP